MKKTTRTTASTVWGLTLSCLLGGASFAGQPPQAVAYPGGEHARPGLFVSVPGATSVLVAPLPSPPAVGPSDRVYAGGPPAGRRGPVAPEPEPEDEWALRPTPGQLHLAGNQGPLNLPDTDNRRKGP